MSSSFLHEASAGSFSNERRSGTRERPFFLFLSALLEAQLPAQNDPLSPGQANLDGLGVFHAAGSARAGMFPHPTLCVKRVILKGATGREVWCSLKCRCIGTSSGRNRESKEWWAPGKVKSVGQVNFNSNMDAWALLRKDKGQKFYCGSKQLWHTWRRPKEEAKCHVR